METRTATAELISEMTERIVRSFHPLQVILFGSHARGQGRPDSDIDLLVVLPDGVDNREATVEIMQALADLPAFKDVVVTTPGEIDRRGDIVGTVLRPALREGKVLYERE
jgi:predicted nucleotidyltransferase